MRTQDANTGRPRFPGTLGLGRNGGRRRAFGTAAAGVSSGCNRPAAYRTSRSRRSRSTISCGSRIGSERGGGLGEPMRGSGRAPGARSIGQGSDNLRVNGYEVVGCGILVSSGRPSSTLAATLASHAQIHTAEGELFRDAIARAGEYHGLRITKVKERDLYARAAAELGVLENELPQRLTELGRPLGPPWRQD